MSILNEILQNKKKEVEYKKSVFTNRYFEQSVYFSTPCVSLKKYIRKFYDQFSIIAEFKRKSPSVGDIRPFALVEEITLEYMRAGAAALSVLNDEKFFGAMPDDISKARAWHYCPILCKDFIVDEFQIIEAKSKGADVILLIASILDLNRIKTFTSLARSLGMEVLMEFHDEEDIRKCENFDEYDLAGINHRNLKSQTISFAKSEHLCKLLPPEKFKIAESGIKDAPTLVKLRKCGFSGFLIGEYFMSKARPGITCSELIDEACQLINNPIPCL
ncbi:MAG: indole-3-glycerol phosphate synthase TrpC [Bacteroidia bacterium]|nr:indole-3-glycerol phosphate synthase TrpC [Bacteroidia bacterium]